MNEGLWLTCDDPNRMLRHLARTSAQPRAGLLAWVRPRGETPSAPPDERKLSVFASACFGLLSGLEHRLTGASDVQRGLAANCRELARSYVEGRGNRWSPTARDVFGTKPVAGVQAALLTVKFVLMAMTHASGGDARGAVAERGRRDVCSLIRCVVGNPFRPESPIAPSILAWGSGVVGSLAHAADEYTLPSGHLDPDRLAVLSDALEDAGCTDAPLLGHLRAAGPHVRGCHAIDLLTGRGGRP
jgi:hypothetical protein